MAEKLATTADGTPIHIPVMLSESKDLLLPALDHPGAIYVDLTCGMAGHAAAILEAAPDARLIGFDQDTDAIDIAVDTLQPRFDGRFTIVHARFDQIDDVLADLGIEGVDAIFADLGLSSLQIDQRERGFAYAADAPLDMRMNADQSLTAAEIVNTYSARELSHIFTRYGDQPAAQRVADAIVTARADEPFANSTRLVTVITDALPASLRYSGGHPAKRVFQALRIEVNQELAALETMLPAALEHLNIDGRIAVLSYHSGEDRIVKSVFAKATSDNAPAKMPVVPEELKAQFAPVTRGALTPSAHEVEANPRSASAKLRGISRIRRCA